MQLICKAKLAFKKLKPANKPGFGTKVIAALTNNADTFPDLPVKIADLQTANDVLTKTIPLALTGNHESIAALRNAVLNWNDVFTRVANQVTTVAEGDVQIILAAGFEPTKSESTRRPKPGTITNFYAGTNGFKNAVVAGTNKAVPNADAFGYIAVPQGATINTDGNMTIVTIGSNSIYFMACTQKQAELYNLPEGVPYTINMFAINSAGTGPSVISQPVRPQ